MKKIFFILFCFSVSVSVFSQENKENLEDELFGNDENTVLTQEETKKENVSNSLKLAGDLNTAQVSLENSKLRIGGSLDSKLSLDFIWEEPYSKKEDYKQSFLNNERSLMTVLGASLFFDARPVENLKLYGKFIFGFPFEKNLNGSVLNKDKEPIAPVTVNGAPNIKIQELYTDFSAKDIVFFRFGKHAVKWGTGYFYSPADVINISRIDPKHPELDREGAVSLRTHIIIPKSQHNIWLYLLPDTSSFLPENTAGAAKAEFVIGDWELGIGGWYRYKKAPRLISTLSGSIAGTVGIFAEGVFAWGSDYVYKNENTGTVYEEKNKPFFQATIGASYSSSKTDTSVSAQYFYNGFGKKNPSEAVNGNGNKGQHYIALSVSQNKIGTDKLSAIMFQEFRISESEGHTSLNLNWKIYKFASMSTGPNFKYPLSKNSTSKGSIGYSISFKLGGGNF
ncbi:hypothetical protein [Treponema pedis]|uniref:hypothetical protein n=1 Tax=Treponema pedis TaxID=409322 RepID=UPI003D2203F4